MARRDRAPPPRTVSAKEGTAQATRVGLAKWRAVGGAVTPRPAQEIWVRMDKAGLGRYARIVLVGDEPGATAVGYHLLKLMGYADLKVRPS